MNQELEQYLQNKGWAFRVVEGGRQVRIDDPCPFCGKKKHFMFSAETTKWDCKRCGQTGNLLTLKRELGDLKTEVKTAAQVFYRGAPDKVAALPGERPPTGMDTNFHQRLIDGAAPDVVEYLTTRGFTMETIRRFKIGVCGNGNALLISIPHYYRGELVCLKFRTVPPMRKSFRRWKDCPSVLFNGDCLEDLAEQPPHERRVFICEGETDAMALCQLGYRYVVASTTGAGKSDWPEHWLAPLEPATEICLVYDSDTAGEEGAAKAAKILGKFRCRRVVPPLHDCAKMVEAGYGRQEFDQAIAEGKLYDDGSVRPLGAFADQLRNMLSSEAPKGRTTGWATLDTILGGVRDGELSIITGDTGSGKSTWSTALARSQAAQGTPVLIAPFEQPCYEILGKLVSMDARASVFDLPPVEREHAIIQTLEREVYFLDRYGPTPFGEIKDAIYLAYHRYGVRFVLLDHLHFFLDCKEHEERHQIDQVVRALKVITRDLGVHIALVCHPKKLGRDQRGNTRKVVLDDLKGSSSIKQACDTAIRVRRLRVDDVGSESDGAEVAVLKCRNPAGREGSAWFHFDPQGERYIEAPAMAVQPECKQPTNTRGTHSWGTYEQPN